MYLLKNRLKSKYEIINISFEGIGEEPFASNKGFVNMFIYRVAKSMKFTNIKEEDIVSQFRIYLNLLLHCSLLLNEGLLVYLSLILLLCLYF